MDNDRIMDVSHMSMKQLIANIAGNHIYEDLPQKAIIIDIQIDENNNNTFYYVKLEQLSFEIRIRLRSIYGKHFYTEFN